MRRREFITLLGGAAAALPLAARAQQSAKTYRIGYLGPGAASVLPAAFNAFRQQLHQLGYVEGQNLTIDYELESGRLLDREIGRFGTPENFVDIRCRASEQLDEAWRI